MLCLMSPTMKRLLPLDTRAVMSSCTPLVSWYSSIITSLKRRRMDRAAGEGKRAAFSGVK